MHSSVKFSVKFTVLSCSLLLLASCSGGNNQPTIEVIQDMMDQPSLKAQEYDQARNEPAMRVPPEGTVPRGFTPYQYKGDPLAAEAKLQNPLKESDVVLQRGEKLYNIYCSVCHGSQGKGDGTVAYAMPLKPPSLLNERARNFKDGRLFHIITEGQGVMGSYATQIFKEEDRWAVVNYVRKLQAQNPGGE